MKNLLFIPFLFISSLANIINIPIHKISSQQFAIQIDQEPTSNSEEPYFTPQANVKNYLNDQYTATIYLGSNQQPFELLIDTGSSWLWVGEKDNFQFDNHFYCNASETCHEDKESQVVLTYGMGHGSGYITIDKASIGDASLSTSQVFLAMQDFALPKNIYFNADGIIGLGVPTEPKGFPTLVQNMYKENIIKDNCYSVYISNDAASLNTRSGNLMIGGYDPKLVKENSLKFVRINPDQGHWKTSLDGMSVGNKELTFSHKLSAIFDTGSSLIYVPQSLMMQIAKNFGSISGCLVSDNLEISCRCDVDFPEIEFDLDGVKTSLSKDFYIWEYQKVCNVQMAAIKYQSWVVLGDVYLRKYYTLYSYSNQTVGIAEAVQYKASHPFVVWGIIGCMVLAGFFVLVVGIHFKRSFKNNRKSLENSVGSLLLKNGPPSTEVEFQDRKGEQQ